MSTAECASPQIRPFIRRERPIYAILGMLLMSVGFAVCDTGFFGFVLAAPFWTAGFVFCLMTALALVNRELPTARRIVGGVVVVLGVLCLFQSLGLAVAIVSPLGRAIQQHRSCAAAGVRGLEWAGVGLGWIVPPAIIAFGQHLRSKAGRRQLWVRAAYWAAYFPVVGGTFILFAVLGWVSGN